MQIIKPHWVSHEDDKGNPQTIYSLHVHPDGTRLATGSIQNVIKIWSTAPILDLAVEACGEEAAPRLLCSMEGHDGAVLCVRWSCNGCFLASSSDDAIVMVWFRSPAGIPSKSFGSKKVNIEDWKPGKRLAGHTSDVTGVAWSHDDQYLASVGLDSLVLIWDCRDSAFILLRRLDSHQGFVKGVVWDPIGEYLATQSDDRTVKIWRTGDWEREADITEPFIDCPTSTFFRRLSWSPDGAHLVTPNAMNGPVFVSAVIDRYQWTSAISLVGHQNVVEVAAHNPHTFLKDKNKPVAGENICSVLALGARNSISVWLTNSSTPILVLHDVFDRDILDLSWAADGVTLYACSSEGRVAAFVIKEIMSVIHRTSPEMKARYLQSLYSSFKPNQCPQQRLKSDSHSRFMSPLPAIEPYRTGAIPFTQSNRAPSVNRPAPPVHQVQQMSIMPNDLLVAAPHPSVSCQNGILDHITSSLRPVSEERRRVALPIVEGIPSALDRQVSACPSTACNRRVVWMQTPPIQATLSATTPHAEPGLELQCLNVEALRESKIRLTSTPLNEELWSRQVLGCQVVSIALNAEYAAIGCDDGTLLAYTATGRQALPTIAMDSACCTVLLTNNFLMAITSSGMVMIWDVKRVTATGPAIRLTDLPISKEATISSTLTTNGLPVISVDQGASYTYDRDLMAWISLKNQSLGSDGADSLHEQETKLHGAIVLGNLNDLEATLMSHLRYLMATKASSKVEEICSEIWSGQGALFGEGGNSSTARLKLNREDRVRLLLKAVDCLRQQEMFSSICNEYQILLRHVP